MTGRVKQVCTAALMLGLLGSSLLGCHQTTEQITVAEKKGTTSQERQNSPGETGQGREGENKTVTLGEQVQVPERFQDSLVTEDGMFTMVADAGIEIPDEEGISLKTVKHEAISQEELEVMGKTLFQGNPLMGYTDKEEWGQMSAAEWGQWQKCLEDLESRAQGEGLVHIRDRLAELAALKNAKSDEPAMEELPLVIPEEARVEEPGKRIWEREKGALNGFVTIGEKKYEFILNSETFDGVICHRAGFYNRSSFDTEYFTATRLSDQSEAFAMETSRETLVERGNQLVKDLELEDMQLAGTEYQKAASPYLDEDQTISGLRLHYTRTVDGIPILYYRTAGDCPTSGGISREQKGEEGVPAGVSWEPEGLTLLYTDEGLEQAVMTNPCQIENVGNEKVFLLPFAEISQVFHQMIAETYKPYSESGIKTSMEIQEVKLGYVRARESGQAAVGTLVPAWVFYGTMDQDQPGGEAEAGTNGQDISQVSYQAPYQAVLIINAMDGTILEGEPGQ